MLSAYTLTASFMPDGTRMIQLAHPLLAPPIAAQPMAAQHTAAQPLALSQNQINNLSNLLLLRDEVHRRDNKNLKRKVKELEQQVKVEQGYDGGRTSSNHLGYLYKYCMGCCQLNKVPDGMTLEDSHICFGNHSRNPMKQFHNDIAVSEYSSSSMENVVVKRTSSVDSPDLSKKAPKVNANDDIYANKHAAARLTDEAKAFEQFQESFVKYAFTRFQGSITEQKDETRKRESESKYKDMSFSEFRNSLLKPREEFESSVKSLIDSASEPPLKVNSTVTKSRKDFRAHGKVVPPLPCSSSSSDAQIVSGQTTPASSISFDPSSSMIEEVANNKIAMQSTSKKNQCTNNESQFVKKSNAAPIKSEINTAIVQTDMSYSGTKEHTAENDNKQNGTITCTVNNPNAKPQNIFAPDGSMYTLANPAMQQQSSVPQFIPMPMVIPWMANGFMGPTQGACTQNGQFGMSMNPFMAQAQNGNVGQTQVGNTGQVQTGPGDPQQVIIPNVSQTQDCPQRGKDVTSVIDPSVPPTRGTANSNVMTNVRDESQYNEENAIDALHVENMENIAMHAGSETEYSEIDPFTGKSPTPCVYGEKTELKILGWMKENQGVNVSHIPMSVDDEKKPVPNQYSLATINEAEDEHDPNDELWDISIISRDGTSKSCEKQIRPDFVPRLDLHCITGPMSPKATRKKIVIPTQESKPNKDNSSERHQKYLQESQAGENQPKEYHQQYVQESQQREDNLYKRHQKYLQEPQAWENNPREYQQLYIKESQQREDSLWESHQKYLQESQQVDVYQGERHQQYLQESQPKEDHIYARLHQYLQEPQAVDDNPRERHQKYLQESQPKEDHQYEGQHQFLQELQAGENRPREYHQKYIQESQQREGSLYERHQQYLQESQEVDVNPKERQQKYLQESQPGENNPREYQQLYIKESQQREDSLWESHQKNLQESQEVDVNPKDRQQKYLQESQPNEDHLYQGQQQFLLESQAGENRPREYYQTYTQESQQREGSLYERHQQYLQKSQAVDNHTREYQQKYLQESPREDNSSERRLRHLEFLLNEQKEYMTAKREDTNKRRTRKEKDYIPSERRQNYLQESQAVNDNLKERQQKYLQESPRDDNSSERRQRHVRFLLNEQKESHGSELYKSIGANNTSKSGIKKSKNGNCDSSSDEEMNIPKITKKSKALSKKSKMEPTDSSNWDTSSEDEQKFIPPETNAKSKNTMNKMSKRDAIRNEKKNASVSVGKVVSQNINKISKDCASSNWDSSSEDGEKVKAAAGEITHAAKESKQVQRCSWDSFSEDGVRFSSTATKATLSAQTIEAVKTSKPAARKTAKQVSSRDSWDSFSDISFSPRADKGACPVPNAKVASKTAAAKSSKTPKDTSKDSWDSFSDDDARFTTQGTKGVCPATHVKDTSKTPAKNSKTPNDPSRDSWDSFSEDDARFSTKGVCPALNPKVASKTPAKKSKKPKDSSRDSWDSFSEDDARFSAQGTKGVCTAKNVKAASKAPAKNSKTPNDPSRDSWDSFSEDDARFASPATKVSFPVKAAKNFSRCSWDSFSEDSEKNQDTHKDAKHKSKDSPSSKRNNDTTRCSLGKGSFETIDSEKDPFGSKVMSMTTPNNRSKARETSSESSVSRDQQYGVGYSNTEGKPSMKKQMQANANIHFSRPPSQLVKTNIVKREHINDLSYHQADGDVNRLIGIYTASEIAQKKCKSNSSTKHGLEKLHHDTPPAYTPMGTSTESPKSRKTSAESPKSRKTSAESPKSRKTSADSPKSRQTSAESPKSRKMVKNNDSRQQACPLRTLPNNFDPKNYTPIKAFASASSSSSSDNTFKRETEYTPIMPFVISPSSAGSAKSSPITKTISRVGSKDCTAVESFVTCPSADDSDKVSSRYEEVNSEVSGNVTPRVMEIGHDELPGSTPVEPFVLTPDSEKNINTCDLEIVSADEESIRVESSASEKSQKDTVVKRKVSPVKLAEMQKNERIALMFQVAGKDQNDEPVEPATARSAKSPGRGLKKKVSSFLSSVKSTFSKKDK